MPSGDAERAQTSTIASLGPMQAAVRLHSLCRTFTNATHSRKLLPLLSRVSAGLHTPPRPQTFGFEHTKPRIGSLVPHSRTMAAAVSGAGAQPSLFLEVHLAVLMHSAHQHDREIMDQEDSVQCSVQHAVASPHPASPR